MNLPEFSVKKPVAMIMFYMALFVLSVVAFSKLAIDLLPEITMPALTITTTYQGAAPEEVELKITKIIESQVSITPGLKEMQSVSQENVSAITLSFNWGVNLDNAANDVRDRLDFAKRFLPEDADKPQLLKFDTNQMPVFFIAASAAESYPKIKDILDDKIVEPLKRISGVGNIMVRSPSIRQINVNIDKFKLQSRGLTISDITNSLRMNNLTQPAGTLKIASKEYLIRVPGEFENISEISDIPVGNLKGQTVYLKDVAAISDSFIEQTEYIRANRKKGAMIIVQKKSGGNTVKIGEAIKEKLEELKKKLPPDIELNILMDNSKDIRDTINNLRDTVIIGGILVILVTYIFLVDWSASLVVLVTIPASLIIAFLFLYIMGYTINIMSLSSLSLAIGQVVDCAIVVLENIVRHREELKEDKITAAINGTTEMGLAISASIFTNIVVYIPLIFTQGISGIMFKQLGVITSITLLVSLLAALTLSPFLAARVIKEKKKTGFFADISEKSFNWIHKEYNIILVYALRNRWKMVGIFSAVFLISLLLIPIVGTEFFPEEDTGSIITQIDMPVGNNVETTNAAVSKIEDVFDKKVPEKVIYLTRSGKSSGKFGGMSGQKETSATGFLWGMLVDKNERKRGTKEIAEVMRKEIGKIPGISKFNVSSSDPMHQRMMGGSGKPITIEIMGLDFEQLDSVSEKVQKILENTKDVRDVSVSREKAMPEYSIKIDRLKAASLGIPIQVIADTTNNCFAGKISTVYREAGHEYDIFVRLQPEDRKDITDLEGIEVRSPSGGKIPLKNFVKIEKTLGAVAIERKDQTRLVKVEANTSGERSIGKITADVKAKISKLPLTKDVTIEFGGSIKEQRKAFTDLLLAFSLGILLTYMVMAAQFESFRDPFIIMFSIPFGVVGVIWSLLITGQTLNITSFIGLIMLVGIVVNNAIVFIDYTIRQKNRGVKIYDALLESGRVRLRPILMTSLTTIFGMLPLALSRGKGSETWASLGITVIGGLTVSMFITLIIIPVVYSLFEDKTANPTVK
ncbi:MAG: efflux RND transporter permease subunit [Elusimicrobia bacterium]|nr:efflux RND transporter permease subunit [Elusimicrobiota bacterium]